jgi:hypothetical protein
MNGQHPSLEKKVILSKFYVNCCNILYDFILLSTSICHADHTVFLNILRQSTSFCAFPLHYNILCLHALVEVPSMLKVGRSYLLGGINLCAESAFTIMLITCPFYF